MKLEEFKPVNQYKAINNAKQDALFQNQQQQFHLEEAGGSANQSKKFFGEFLSMTFSQIKLSNAVAARATCDPLCQALA